MLASRFHENIATALAEPTLCGAFQVTARANAGQIALQTFEGDEAVSWDEYADQVRAIAGGLHALGVGPDDTVALLLRNRPVFNIVDTAVLHLGAVPFSLYHTEPVAQLLALVENSGARVIITEPAFLEKVDAVVRHASGVEHVLLDADRTPGNAGMKTLSEVAELGDASFDFDAAWQAVSEESTATLVYTSGTTGAPKAVQIPHRAVMNSLRGVDGIAPLRAPHTGISFLPAAHITDRFICHYTTIGLGGTLTCVPDPDRLWDAIADTAPTRFFGVPRTWEKLMDRARTMIDDDAGLTLALEHALARVRAEQSGKPLSAEAARLAEAASEAFAPVRAFLGLDKAEWLTAAAAPSAYEVLEFHHAIGLPIAELWGMTECMMAVMNPPERIKLGTVGVPLPAVEVRIADDGELLLRGGHACSGYRNDPEQTAAMFDPEGWLHSGDLASVDADGYVSIVGRKKEQMINSSGKNLFPVKIEQTIAQCSPLIGQIAAIGDRRRWVTALIVLDPEPLAAFAAEHGLSGSHAELARAPEVHAEVQRAVDAGNERLARVEQVRGFTILDEVWLPGSEVLTNTLKLRRAAIDERYAASIDAMYS